MKNIIKFFEKIKLIYKKKLQFLINELIKLLVYASLFLSTLIIRSLMLKWLLNDILKNYFLSLSFWNFFVIAIATMIVLKDVQKYSYQGTNIKELLIEYLRVEILGNIIIIIYFYLGYLLLKGNF